MNAGTANDVHNVFGLLGNEIGSLGFKFGTSAKAPGYPRYGEPRVVPSLNIDVAVAHIEHVGGLYAKLSQNMQGDGCRGLGGNAAVQP